MAAALKAMEFGRCFFLLREFPLGCFPLEEAVCFREEDFEAAVRL